MRYGRMAMAAAMLVATAGCAGSAGTAPQTPLGQQTSWNDRKTLDEALVGMTPGKPVTCLPPVRSPNSSAYGSTVLYRQSGRLIYRNDLGPGCERLGRGDILVTQNTVGRSCRGDIIRTVDPITGMTTGGCAFNDFVPYTRAK